MSLPITPVYQGESPEFFRRLMPMIESLPSLFTTLQRLSLEKCYTSLRGLRFVERLERGNVLSWYDLSNDVVNIYPLAFRSGNRVDITLYTGLGQRHWEKHVSSTGKYLWNNKLVTTTPSTMDKLSKILKGSWSSYKGVLDQFQSAADRLQVIHVLNTLKANNVRPSDKLVDIYTYPPTKEFVTGQRSFSLTPLLSVYRGNNGLEMKQYEYAFSEYVSMNGRVYCTEMSTEQALIELFEYVSGID